MNYRHAYHAGNHTELLKHTALILILRHLCEKPKGFFVLDTHAGLGAYDLNSEKAQKTREAEDGILRFARQSQTPSPLLELVRGFNNGGDILRYPGSPAIVRAHLRESDRLIACELHEQDIKVLKRNLANDRRLIAQQRNGYEAMNALLPPHERRGLVFIDPPFEKPDEEETLANALINAHRKWATGIYLAWYPIKSDRPVARLKSALADAAIPNVLSVELTLAPADGERLVGGGVMIINPPWKLDSALEAAARDVRIGLRAHRGEAHIEWITPHG